MSASASFARPSVRPLVCLGVLGRVADQSRHFGMAGIANVKRELGVGTGRGKEGGHSRHIAGLDPIHIRLLTLHYFCDLRVHDMYMARSEFRF